MENPFDILDPVPVEPVNQQLLHLVNEYLPYHAKDFTTHINPDEVTQLYAIDPNSPDAPLFDGRETASGLFLALDKLGLPYKKVENMLIGDCVVSYDCCIEIKRITPTGNDLWESLKDGRLYEQSYVRQQTYEKGIIIIEVDDQNNMYNPYFTEKHFNSIRLSLEIQYRQHVFLTGSMQDTIDLIYRIWKKEKEGEHYHDPTNKEPMPVPLIDKQRYLLSGLLDVGREKTLELVHEFGCPLNVFHWILNRDRALKGYGPKFFEKNRELLTAQPYITIDTLPDNQSPGPVSMGSDKENE